MLSREEWEAAKAKAPVLSREEFEREKRMAAHQRQVERGDFNEEYSAASDSGLENFMAGVGAGAVGVKDRAVNLLLPKALERGRYTDEGIRERKAMEADLMETGAGSAGKMAGEIAVTLPLGGAIGAAGKGLSAASGVPSLARAGAALSAPTGYGARAAVGALEGAGQAALTSEPGQGLQETAFGGGLGGGFGVLGKAVGQTARKLRPEITPEARLLMKTREQEIRANLAASGITDPKQIEKHVRENRLFVPASQALPEGTIGRQINEGLLANLPGSGGVIRGQRNKAVETVRQDLMEKAVPEGVPLDTVIQQGDRMSDSMPRLKAAWDSAYDDVYQRTIPNVNIDPDLAATIRNASKDLKGNPRIKVSGDLTGREALDLSQAMQQVINEMPSGALSKAAKADLQAQREALEQHIIANLPTDVADRFVKNRAAYKNYLAVRDAAKKSVGDEFSLRQAERSLAKKGGSSRETALLGAQVLKDFPSRQGIFQTLASTGAVGGGAGALGFFASGEDATLADKLRNAAVMGSIGLAGPRLMATEPMQRAFAQYGEKGVLDALEKQLRTAGRIGRAGAVSSASQAQE